MSERDAFGGRWQPPVIPEAHEDPAPYDESPSRPENPVPEPRSLAAKLAAPLIAIVAFASKIKFFLLAILKLKFLASAGSMLVSIVAYGAIWGWQFGIGFVLLLFIHEMGHVIQLKREGLEASAPMFIPFMGAVVWAKSLGDDAVAEARVALAGPILGSIGAAACVGIYWATGNELFLAMAFVGFFLNLFNLAPISPLDGGRTVAAISPWLWLVGVFVMAALAFTHPNPILLLIAFVAIYQTYHRFKAFREGGEEARAYYRIGTRNRLLVSAVYFGLIIALALAMHYTHVERTL